MSSENRPNSGEEFLVLRWRAGPWIVGERRAHPRQSAHQCRGSDHSRSLAAPVALFCLEFYRHAFKLRDFRPERKCSTWARRQPLPTSLGPKINTDPCGGHRDASQIAVSSQLSANATFCPLRLLRCSSKDEHLCPT